MRPILDDNTFPWHRPEAVAAFDALSGAIKAPNAIDLLYRQCGDGLPSLTLSQSPDLIWKEVLEKLTVGKRSRRLCERVLQMPDLASCHEAVRALMAAVHEVDVPTSPGGEPAFSSLAGNNSARPWHQVSRYAALSFVSFACGLVLVGLLLWQADRLATYGLTGRFYYLVLLPLGLAAAAFLFGALRSFARYRGRQFGGALELGGPLVGFALVILGGFLLPPPPANFPLTVYVHCGAGLQDLVPQGSGRVLLDLGSERRSEPIGDRGQVFFPEIPASFQGRPVNVSIDSYLYEVADPGQVHRLESSSLYLAVRRKPARIRGLVLDEDGRPIGGAHVTVADATDSTDTAGRFELVVSGDRVRPEMSLQTIAVGHAPWHGSVVPHGNEVTVVLQRER